MVLYFLGAISALKEFKSNYGMIVKILESMGHTVIADHILDHENSDEYKRDEKYINFVSKRIRGSDGMIAEISFPTSNISYEITCALENGKPVLALYSEDNQFKTKPLLVGSTKDIMFVRAYKSANLETIVKEGIRELSATVSKKFSFNVTSTVYDYLEWVAKKKGVSRSVFLRSLVEQSMKKDKDYISERIKL